MESLLHRAYREIVVDTAVENGDAIFPDRLEKEGECHWCTDSVSEISIFEDNSFFAVDIRGHATEWDKEIVEIPAGFCCRLWKQGHKRLIHLDRIDQTLWKETGFHL